MSGRGWRLTPALALAACGTFGANAKDFTRAGQTAQAPTAPEAATRSVGTVKSISGRTITLVAESGPEMNVKVAEGARVLRVEPGAKDLKSAAPLELSEIVPGDRILVRGKLAADGKSMEAISVIAMKKEDIAAKRAREREEWQRHSVGGLVAAIDAGASTVTINTSAMGANKIVVVRIGKDTVLRRYAPGSIQFDDAMSAPLTEIKAGDQLRARGTRSADGGEFTADEVVSGTFRNIAGTIAAIDAGAETITVNDLASKRVVKVKVTGDSQLRKLSPEMAQRIAARLKARANGGEGETQPPGAGANEKGAGQRGAGGGDLQQAISRMPAAKLPEMQKGDAVMIVAAAANQENVSTVIALLAGVEPILTASPKEGQSILSPWSLGGAPSGE